MKELFANWMTLQKWGDMKFVFEHWLSCYDKNGNLNMPDLGLFNQYLRANLMMKMSPGDMLELVAKMEECNLKPNTASYNLVLKAMHETKDIDAAVQFLDRYAFLCFLLCLCLFG